MASPADWLGLARRSGKVAIGRYACRQAVQRRRVALLVVAEDGSASARRHWERVAQSAGVRLVVWGTKDELARALGAPGQAAVVAILDRGLASNFLAAVSGCVEDARGRRPGEFRSDAG